MAYDLAELEVTEYKYFENPTATIPCPDCADHPALTLAEDQPFVAALLSFCPLCNDARHITQARALAVLPHVCNYTRELKEKLKKATLE